jgi:hypothetical protein
VDWDDVSLYERQAATLVASWAAYATGSTGARVARSEGVSAAVFPTAPERGVYNNALLECGTDAARRSTAVETMERVYTDAGVDHYAAWVHESDAPMIGQLTGSGYRFDSSTRVMAMSLDAIPVPEPEIELGEASWEEYLRIIDGPDGLLAGVDPSAFHVLVARLDGRNAGTALAYDHDGDCGIYNVVTLPDAR